MTSNFLFFTSFNKLVKFNTSLPIGRVYDTQEIKGCHLRVFNLTCSKMVTMDCIDCPEHHRGTRWAVRVPENFGKPDKKSWVEFDLEKKICQECGRVTKNKHLICDACEMELI